MCNLVINDLECREIRTEHAAPCSLARRFSICSLFRRRLSLRSGRRTTPRSMYAPPAGAAERHVKTELPTKNAVSTHLPFRTDLMAHTSLPCRTRLSFLLLASHARVQLIPRQRSHLLPQLHLRHPALHPRHRQGQLCRPLMRLAGEWPLGSRRCRRC